MHNLSYTNMEHTLPEFHEEVLPMVHNPTFTVTEPLSLPTSPGSGSLAASSTLGVLAVYQPHKHPVFRGGQEVQRMRIVLGLGHISLYNLPKQGTLASPQHYASVHLRTTASYKQPRFDIGNKVFMAFARAAHRDLLLLRYDTYPSQVLILNPYNGRRMDALAFPAGVKVIEDMAASGKIVALQSKPDASNPYGKHAIFVMKLHRKHNRRSITWSPLRLIDLSHIRNQLNISLKFSRDGTQLAYQQWIKETQQFVVHVHSDVSLWEPKQTSFTKPQVLFPPHGEMWRPKLLHYNGRWMFMSSPSPHNFGMRLEEDGPVPSVRKSPVASIFTWDIPGPVAEVVHDMGIVFIPSDEEIERRFAVGVDPVPLSLRLVSTADEAAMWRMSTVRIAWMIAVNRGRTRRAQSFVPAASPTPVPVPTPASGL